MKKIILSVILLSITANAFAKKVKFAVDLGAQTISPQGVHITSDFQTLAGYPGGDWTSNTTPMIQEGLTGIYSLVVDIPAFAKYEYKIVNGDQFYEAEFVPIESRVGYNFDDNRWIYIDSLANDTTFVGAIIFAGNAPAGLTLLRCVVDMQNETVSPDGVHLAGNFQGWNTSSNILYSFGSNIYETITYITAGTYEYKFYNGNTSGSSEIVPLTCGVNTNREIQVTSDIVLPTVCFGSCVACIPNGISENVTSSEISISPNPATNYSIVQLNNNSVSHTIYLTDVTGRVIHEYNNYNGKTLRIEKQNLEAGIYFVTILSDANIASTVKLIFE